MKFLRNLLAQIKGIDYEHVRLDVLASRAVTVVAAVAGLATFAGRIPGKEGIVAATVCGIAAGFLPRLTKAANILAQAQSGAPTVKQQLIQALAIAKLTTADQKTAAQSAAVAQNPVLQSIIKQAVADELERSKSFQNTPAGLVESGILASPAAAAVIADAAPTVSVVAKDAPVIAKDAPIVAEAAPEIAAVLDKIDPPAAPVVAAVVSDADKAAADAPVFQTAL